jgi:hypothetical protein
MSVWVDRQDVVSVAATRHGVEQVAALGGVYHEAEEEAWVDGLVHVHTFAMSFEPTLEYQTKIEIRIGHRRLMVSSDQVKVYGRNCNVLVS